MVQDLSYPKVLGWQIALAKDELAGQGLYKGKKAKGDRRQALEQQIQRWQALREQLGDRPLE